MDLRSLFMQLDAQDPGASYFHQIPNVGVLMETPEQPGDIARLLADKERMRKIQTQLMFHDMGPGPGQAPELHKVDQMMLEEIFNRLLARPGVIGLGERT